MGVGTRPKKNREKIQQQARNAAYSQLVAKPTDLAIINYLRTNFSTASGDTVQPNGDDVAVVRYILALVEGGKAQFPMSKFREVLEAWTGDDKEEYQNQVAELEKTLLAKTGAI
jgi:hypothetical protein